MMPQRVLVVGLLDAVADAVCFRFREQGYLVHLLALASPQAVASWQRKMQEWECDTTAEALDVAISRHQMDVDPPGWQRAHLMVQLNGDAALGLLVERCANLEHIIRVEQDAYAVHPLPLSSSDVRINTIRMVDLVPTHALHVDTASSSAEERMLRRGQAHEVAMLALYLASQDATDIVDAVINVPAGRHLS